MTLTSTDRRRAPSAPEAHRQDRRPKAGRGVRRDDRRTDQSHRQSHRNNGDEPMSTTTRPAPTSIIIMTDEERAAPAVRRRRRRRVASRRARPAARWFDEHAVSFGRHYTGLAGLRAEPTDDLHRPVPRRPRRHPDRRPRQDGRRLAHALAARGRGADARPLVPRRRLRHALRRQVAHLPRRPAPATTAQPLATNDDDGIVDPAAVAALPRRRPARRLRLLRLGRPRAPRRARSPTAACAATR